MCDHREEGMDHGRRNRNSRRHAARLWLCLLLFRHQRQTPIDLIQEPLHPAFGEEDFPASKPSLRVVTHSSSSLRTSIERLLQPLFQLQEPRTELFSELRPPDTTMSENDNDGSPPKLGEGRMPLKMRKR